jgi:hypothetical protein
VHDLKASQDINYGEQIKKNELGGAVSRMGRREINAEFWRRNLKEGDYLEFLSVNGKKK